MKKIKDWVYLLFCPKWERRLYKLLRKASCDKNLRLDTVLYDYCLLEEMEGKVFKAGIDAMFIGWLGLFDAKITARKNYALEVQEAFIYLAEMPDGTAPEYATHVVLSCNLTFKEYLKRIARYIASDDVSESAREYLLDLSEREYLGLVQCWCRRQKAAQLIIAKASDNGISAQHLYTSDYVCTEHKAICNIKLQLRQKLGLKESRVANNEKAANWATLFAYYCSVVK